MYFYLKLEFHWNYLQDNSLSEYSNGRITHAIYSLGNPTRMYDDDKSRRWEFMTIRCESSWGERIPVKYYTQRCSRLASYLAANFSEIQTWGLQVYKKA